MHLTNIATFFKTVNTRIVNNCQCMPMCKKMAKPIKRRHCTCACNAKNELLGLHQKPDYQLEWP